MLSRAFLRPALRFAALPAALLVVSSRCAFAAPSENVAALAGEWTGESDRGALGQAVANKITDARRYWIEGDVVRGETLSGLGEGTGITHIAIVPRGSRFLKIITPEKGEPTVLVGFLAEGGVLWSSPESDKVRFIERVSGSGAERRLEVALPETSAVGEKWKAAVSLKPAVTNDPGAAEVIQPLVLPSPVELALLDRIAELFEQRESSRGNSNANARELATAWRELEEMTARARTAQAELKLAQAALAAAKEGAATREAEARVKAAEKSVADVRSWADGLEKSLQLANTRADEAAARVRTLETDLAGLQAAGTNASTQSAAIHAESERLAARVTELEQQIAAAGTVRSALEQELAGARRRVETLAAERAAIDTQQQTARAESERAAGVANGLQQQLAQAGRERDEAQKRVAALEGTVAELQKRTGEAAAASVAANDLALAQAALRVAESARDEAKRSLIVTRDDAEKLRQANIALEQQTASMRAAAERQAATVASLERRVSEISAAPVPAPVPVAVPDERRVALENELTAARAELAVSETRQAEAQRMLADARNATTTAVSQGRLMESDLGASRARVLELESAVAAGRARTAELERDAETLRAQASARTDTTPTDTRIAVLEQRLADTYVRADARQADFDRLTARAAELEAERAALTARLASSVNVPAAPVREIDQLNRRIEQLESARSELEMRNTDLATRLRETEVRLASSRETTRPTIVYTPVAVPVAAPAPVASRPVTQPAPISVPITPVRVAESSEPEVRVRFPVASTVAPATTPAPSSTSIRLPPTRPTDGATSGSSGSGISFGLGDAAVAQAIKDLPVQGFRRTSSGGTIVVGGRAVRAGDAVDTARGVRFVRIDSDAIVFTGPDGREYRRKI